MGCIYRKLWASAINPPSNAALPRNGKFTPGCTAAISSPFQIFSFQMCRCWSGFTWFHLHPHGCLRLPLKTERPCRPPPARLPAWGQSRASLLPWRALTQSSVSDSHLLFIWCNRLSHTCLKVTSVPLHLILLIRGESWGILLWLITVSIPLGLSFSLHLWCSACQLLLFIKKTNPL